MQPDSGSASTSARDVTVRAIDAPAPLEVRIAPERTRAGAPVIAIGMPRLAIDASFGALDVRVAVNRVFAVDGESVRTWRLDTGVAESRFVPAWKSYPQTSLAVALDGMRIAAGSLQAVSYLEAPFVASSRTLSTHRPVQFAIKL